MKNLGKYPIWFTGSRRIYQRVIYNDGKKYFCKWYGQMIEVRRFDNGHFYTFEEY